MSDIEQEQLHREKWVVYFPEGAPYAGIRTESGVTIAGTSSGLSKQDAEEICANLEDVNGAFVLIGLLAKARKERDEANERLRAIIEQDNVEPIYEVNYGTGSVANWQPVTKEEMDEQKDYFKVRTIYLHPPKDSTELASKDWVMVQREPIKGKRYESGDWSLRNYEAYLEDQIAAAPYHA